MTRVKSPLYILLLLSLVLACLAGSARAAAPAPEKQWPEASARIVGEGGTEKKKPANGKEKLAVLDLERSGDGIDVDLAYSMSVVLRDELFAQGQFEVLSREDIMALAKRLALQQAAGDDCTDDTCLVSFGRSLGTRFMVAGVLSKVGNTYSVSLRLLDTEGENAGVLNRVYERCKCSHDELFDTVAKAAAKLMGKVPQVAAAAPVPASLPAAVAAPVSATTLSGNSTDSVTSMEFVSVPGGCFQMGDTFGDGQSNEKPMHEVCVDGFSVGKYEVTQGQWQKVMGNNPSAFKKGDNYPVESVSWNDAQEFISKLNRQSGKSYRLPTEAEWEYAARSGGKREKYSGSDNIDAVACYSSNSSSATHPVGAKAANGLGIYDMSGNAWEWCQDWFADSYYASSPRQNPLGPQSGSGRVIRGGSWFNVPWNVRAAYRNGYEPGYRNYRLGFRLILPVQ